MTLEHVGFSALVASYTSLCCFMYVVRAHMFHLALAPVSQTEPQANGQTSS